MFLDTTVSSVSYVKVINTCINFASSMVTFPSITLSQQKSHISHEVNCGLSLITNTIGVIATNTPTPPPLPHNPHFPQLPTLPSFLKFHSLLIYEAIISHCPIYRQFVATRLKDGCLASIIHSPC